METRSRPMKLLRLRHPIFNPQQHDYEVLMRHQEGPDAKGTPNHQCTDRKTGTRSHKILASLTRLPPELLVQIASFCTVPTILVLSQTCRIVRTGVLDPSTFRSKLEEADDRSRPGKESWIDAIAQRANDDALVWARFALAHERSRALPQGGALSRPGDMANALLWVPALAVIKHPFLHHPEWPWFNRLSGAACEVSFPWIFVNLLMFLCPQVESETRWRSRPQDIWIRFRPQARVDAVIHLRVVRAMLPDIRMALHRKQQFWCNVSQGTVPLLQLPVMTRLPLEPLDDSYHSPLPFRSTTDATHWRAWFTNHARAMVTSNFLANGTWHGYSTRLGFDGLYASGKDSAIESSIVNVSFDLTACSQGERPDRSCIVEDARDCYDRFSLDGRVWFDGEVCRLHATKRYRNTATRWHWDCLVTPFGIVGFWGSGGVGDADKGRKGLTWLWKEDWSIG